MEPMYYIGLDVHKRKIPEAGNFPSVPGFPKCTAPSDFTEVFKLWTVLHIRTTSSLRSLYDHILGCLRRKCTQGC